MTKRRTFSPEFKVRVVLELISGEKGLMQACREYSIPPRCCWDYSRSSCSAGCIPVTKDRKRQITKIGSICWGAAMLPENRVSTHPGEILLEELLKPMAMSQVALARHLGVPLQRINELVRGRRGVTPRIPPDASPRHSARPRNSG
jgi:hypothetical protein